MLASPPMKKSHQKPAFALIATISVMVLLVLVALAMLSLSTVETRASKNSSAQAKAQANARLALNVMRMCHLNDVRRIICAGSVCAYPKDTSMPMQERNLFDGFPEETNAPYGISKRLLFVLQSAYRQQYGIGGCHLLFANMYGPGDDFSPKTSHVIPALILKMSQAMGKPDTGIVVWGTGEATRDFLFVEDGASAIVQAAKEGWNTDKPINVGTGVDVSIGWLVSELADIMGYEGDIAFDKSRPDGQPRRCLDTNGVERMGWHPRVPLREGLKKTIESMRDEEW